MRMFPFVLLGATAALAACEPRTTDPMIAGIASGGGPVATASALTISPDQVTVPVGTTTQLSTNAGSSQQGQLRWSSSNTTVATVSATGLVTAFLPGTATITARLLSDTSHVASATVLVTSQ